MEDSKFIKIFHKTYFLSFPILIAVSVFSFALAYSPYYTHPDLTEEIARLFNLKNNNSQLEISQNEIQWMRQGAIDEDTPARWINHFYDPIHKTGWSGKHFGNLTPAQGLYEGESMAPKPAIASIDWVTNQEYQSAYGRQYGNQTWQKALKAYIDGDNKIAFTALGHILHLIEDASVPDHTRDDTHADLYGDPGSPFEKYSKEYTNFNKLNIAENLRNESLLSFSTIQDSFNYLANYSNNNFFSEDTISNDEFVNPNLEKLEKKIENIDGKDKKVLYDRQKQIYLAFFKQDNKYTLDNDSLILPSYFSHLAPQAVLTGASVLDLFFREAERYKQSPELLPTILNDTSEDILSYLQKSPRLALVNASDAYDRAKTDAQIYYASATNFFSSIFSTPFSFLTASVGTIPSVQPVAQQPVSQAPAPITSSEDTNTIALSLLMPPPQVAANNAPSPVLSISPSQVTTAATIATSSAPDLAKPTAVQATQIAVQENSQMATGTAPRFLGGGWSSGVSVDVALISPAYLEAGLMSDIVATTTENLIATSTDDIVFATTTDDIITATTTQEIIYPDPVVINEIAWMGTRASYTDEWIELFNKTNADIDLTGWTLESRNKTLSINLFGAIKADSYFLLERTASTTTDQLEDMVFTGAINNDGPNASLYLKNGSTTIDFIDFGYWLAGENGSKKTMERVSPYAEGNNYYNWKTYSEAGALPFAKDAANNNILGTPGAKNSVTGWYVPAASSITQDTIWRKGHGPYFIPSIITIIASSTLTIEPGVVVKFAKGPPPYYYGGGVNIEGALKAEGTEKEPIIFTSFLDDQADGVDSNQDATSSSPASGDWLNINFLNSTRASLLKYTQIRYGGQGTNHNPNGWYPDYTGAVNIQNSSPEIYRSTFASNTAAAIYVKGDSYPKVNQNRIGDAAVPFGQASYLGGVGIRLIDASATAEIVGNTFENNTVAIASRSASTTPLVVRNNAFRGNNRNSEFYSAGWLNLDNSGNHDLDFKGGFHIAFNVKSGESVTLKADTMPYLFEGGEYMTVDADGALIIEPGTVLKSRDVAHTIRGTFKAQGASEKPIIFTSFNDDSDGYDSDYASSPPRDGAWKNIQFIGAGSSDSVLENVVMKYGGEGTNYNPNGWYPTYTGVISVQNSSPIISNVRMENNREVSIYIKGDAHPIIKNSVIKNTATPTNYFGSPNFNYGLQLADASATAEIINNSFENNDIAIQSESASDIPLIIKNNIFINNHKNGIFTGYANFNLDNANNRDQNNKGGFYFSILVASGQQKTLKADAMPYIVSWFRVEPGGALDIEPGSVLKMMNGNSLLVKGALKARGTADQPIIFTTFFDDSDGYDSDNSEAIPQEGSWKNIQFVGASSSDSILEYAVVKYGGSGENTCPYAYLGGPCMQYEGALLIDGASPVVLNSTIDRNLAIALYVKGDARPTISDSAIINTKEAMATPSSTIGGYGISVGAESSPVLINDTYGGNNKNVVYR